MSSENSFYRDTEAGLPVDPWPSHLQQAQGEAVSTFGEPPAAASPGLTAPPLTNAPPPEADQHGQKSAPDPVEPSSNTFVRMYESAAQAKENAMSASGWQYSPDPFKGINPFNPHPQASMPASAKSGTPMVTSFEESRQQQAQQTNPPAAGTQNDGASGNQPNGALQLRTLPAGAIAPMRPDLGDSVKQFESGNRGVAAVSTGVNDPGGVSYGTYQLSSKARTLTSFLTSPEGSGYAAEFHGLTPGSAEFTSKWKEIAARDPEGLHHAEMSFIYRTHYVPKAEVAAANWFDMNNPAIQDAVWSGSVQHKKFDDVIKTAAQEDTHLRYRFADDQLRALYRARSNYTDSLGTVPPEAGRGRYQRELPVVLKRNETYQEAKRR